MQQLLEPLSVEELENLRGWLDPTGPAAHLKTGISVDDALRLIATVDSQKHQLRLNTKRRHKYVEARLRWRGHMRDLRGRLMTAETELAVLLNMAIEVLHSVAPYTSAWEMDGGIRGVDLYDQLQETVGITDEELWGEEA